jgi:hypothetical protein
MQRLTVSIHYSFDKGVLRYKHLILTDPNKTFNNKRRHIFSSSDNNILYDQVSCLKIIYELSKLNVNQIFYNYSYTIFLESHLYDTFYIKKSNGFIIIDDIEIDESLLLLVPSGKTITYELLLRFFNIKSIYYGRKN